MDEVLKVFHQELALDPRFKALMRELNKQHRPCVPSYRPGQSREEADSLLERIKYESGRQEGFDLLFLRLTGERNE